MDYRYIEKNFGTTTIAHRVPTFVMATAYNVQLSPTHSPGFTHVDDLKEESADRVSELLMLNHAKYHTLFNEVGLHSKQFLPLSYV